MVLIKQVQTALTTALTCITIQRGLKVGSKYSYNRYNCLVSTVNLQA